MIRWLEWTLVDPHQSVGGVEIHLLCLAKNLSEKGVEVHYSSNPKDLFENASWDVIHTHGNALPKWYGKRIRNRQAVRIHTLHGNTFSVMLALRQWWRFNFWKALYRELSGCWNADIVCSIHPNLWIYGFFQFLSIFTRQTVLLCPNGWDSAETLSENTKLGAELTDALSRKITSLAPFWCFIGRSADAIKGSNRIKALLHEHPHFNIVAIPGDGFDDHPRLFKTGRLHPRAIAQVIKHADGLLIASLYEGVPLVALEALSQGVVVLSTPVGGLPWLQLSVQGLEWIRSVDSPKAFCSQIEDASRNPETRDETARKTRAIWNQKFIPTWKKSAMQLLATAQKALQSKRSERVF